MLELDDEYAVTAAGSGFCVERDGVFPLDRVTARRRHNLHFRLIWYHHRGQRNLRPRMSSFDDPSDKSNAALSGKEVEHVSTEYLRDVRFV